MSLTFKF